MNFLGWFDLWFRIYQAYLRSSAGPRNRLTASAEFSTASPPPRDLAVAVPLQILPPAAGSRRRLPPHAVRGAGGEN